MPRVVPSKVVEFIDTTFRACEGIVYLNQIEFGQLAGLVDLGDQIPDELLTMDATTYASLVCCKASIRGALSNFTADRQAGRHTRPFAVARNHSPMQLIRSALAKCPDKSPTASTSELSFITDADLGTDLRTDIGRINKALAAGEWKAATVLAGSAVEALLLWALERRPMGDVTNAVAALVASKDLTRQPGSDLNRWGLHEYIEVAASLLVIKHDTAVQTRLTQNFRNLIHPGRAQRLAQKCDRGTALSAVAGVEHVVRDLTP